MANNLRGFAKATATAAATTPRIDRLMLRATTRVVKIMLLSRLAKRQAWSFPVPSRRRRIARRVEKRTDRVVAAITRGGFKQTTFGTPASTAVTGAFSVDPVSGALVITGILWARDTSEVVTTVTDNAGGNTHQLAPGTDLLDSFGTSIFYAMNCNTTAGYSVTVNWSANFTTAVVCSVAYSGAAISSALDLNDVQEQDGVAAGTDTVSSPALGTPSTAGQLVFAMTIGGGGIIDALNAGTNFTAIVAHAGGAAFLFEDWIQTTPTAVAGTFTPDNGPRTWDTAAATFKAAAVESGPIFLPRSQQPDHQNLIASLSL